MAPDAPALQIDLGSEVPAYEQIQSGLRTLLVSGKFRPGDQLPTVRQLALDLGIHHNTVAEAYRLLADEGWLDLRRGRGATVISRPRPTATPESEAQFTRRLEELVAKAIAEGVPEPVIARDLDSTSRKLLTPAENGPKE
jgi:GntR family transcriptional regulator